MEIYVNMAPLLWC